MRCSAVLLLIAFLVAGPLCALPAACPMATDNATPEPAAHPREHGATAAGHDHSSRRSTPPPACHDDGPRLADPCCCRISAAATPVAAAEITAASILATWTRTSDLSLPTRCQVQDLDRQVDRQPPRDRLALFSVLLI